MNKKYKSLEKMSWQSFQQLSRYFTPEQTVGLTD